MTNSDKRKAAAVEVRQRAAVRIRIVDGSFSFLRKATPWVFAWLIFREGRFCLEALAGKETVVSVLVRLFANQWFAWSMATLFGAGGTLYGWRERRLRHDVTVRLTQRNEALEIRLDPNRSSSALTQRGETNQGDE